MILPPSDVLSVDLLCSAFSYFVVVPCFGGHFVLLSGGFMSPTSLCSHCKLALPVLFLCTTIKRWLAHLAQGNFGKYVCTDHFDVHFAKKILFIFGHLECVSDSTEIYSAECFPHYC